jgi:hypothetical protein
MVDGGEMLVGLAVEIAIASAIVRWGTWLGGRYGAPTRAIRAAGWGLAGLWAAMTLGGAWTLAWVTTNVPGSNVSPADRARHLADGIAQAMWLLAMGVVCLGFGAVVMLALTVRYHWLARSPEVEPTGPYR